MAKGPSVDGPLLMGGRYVERVNLDNSAVDAFPPTVVQEIPGVMFAVDLTDKRTGGRCTAPTGRPIHRER